MDKMENNPAAAALHHPVTNIVSVEAAPETAMESLGHTGMGEAWALDEGARWENLPVEELENFMESGEPDVVFRVPNTSGLADIGVASFGDKAQMELVIGTDERIRIKETTTFPFRATASLLITAADNSQWVGTGWFISPRVLATAGHCVLIKNSGNSKLDGWVKKIQVMPGRDGDIMPYGGMTATEFWSVSGWAEGGLEICDYGVIVLPGPFREEIGYMGYGVYPDNELLSSVANIQGYPSDKHDPSGTLWYDKREISSVSPDKVYYAADTAGGQSGAAVYIIKGGQRISVAIHAYGGATANSGTRISPLVFANLEQWKKQYL
jgi:glutamyl endopeptidase